MLDYLDDSQLLGDVLGKHGGVRTKGEQGSDHNLGRGRTYILARLDRDKPELAAKYRKQGRPTKEKPYNIRNLSDRGGDGGNQSAYLLRRLARDHPDILVRYERGHLHAQAIEARPRRPCRNASEKSFNLSFVTFAAMPRRRQYP
jgi:hypothetical protein